METLINQYVGGLGRAWRRGGANGRLRDRVDLKGHLPPLAADVVPIRRGDTLILATDGVRSGFLDPSLPYQEPQALADHVLARWGTPTDDALVLVVRYLGAA